MQKLRLILLSILVLLLPAGLPAQSLPLLPEDPSVTEGRLSDGVGYVIVADNTFKGSADVVLLQRVCQSSEQIAYRDLPLHRGAAVLDSLFVRIFHIIGDSIEEDPEIYGTDNQYIVVAGDVKASDVVARLEKYSAKVPKSRSSDECKPYRPCPFSLPVMKTESLGDGRAVLKLSKVKPRMRRELMGTAVPIVAMNQDLVAEVILKKSLETSFERLGIPFADLKYEVVRSWMTFGDESCSLSVTVPEAESSRAADVIRSLLGDLTIRDLGLNAFVSARDEVWSRAFQEMSRPMSHSAQTQRCISHILHGTPLNSNRSGYEFYASRQLADTVLLRSMRRYMEENFRLANPLGISVDGARIHTSNRRDTLTFPEASKKKAKVAKTSTDFVSGGTFWTFKNGMKVVYKRMKTEGALHYAMVFGCGMADIADAPAGESAFYGDMLFSASVGSRRGRDFLRLCESCGIFMDCRVGLNDMELYGSVKTSDLNLLMRSLLALTTDRTPDPKAAAYAVECLRLGLDPEERVGMMLYERLHPGYRYAPFRSETGLTSTMADNAEKLFRKAFSRADDGLLVLVGDRKEEEVLKVLKRYMDSFAVSGTRKRLTQLTLNSIDGTVTVEESGDHSMSLEVSVPLAFTADNFYAASVLEEGLNDILEGMAAKADLTLNVRPNEHLDLKISSRSDVSREDLMSALEIIAEDGVQAAALKDWKAAVKNRLSYERTRPEYWVEAVRMRHMEAKDISTKGLEKVDAVSADRVKMIARALLEGGCVVYITK